MSDRAKSCILYVFDSLRYDAVTGGDGDFKYVRKYLATSDIDRHHLTRTVQSLVNYAFGTRSVLLRADAPVNDLAMENDLKAVLRKHNENCRSVSFESTRFEVDDATEEALADLGYR